MHQRLLIVKKVGTTLFLLLKKSGESLSLLTVPLEAGQSALTSLSAAVKSTLQVDVDQVVTPIPFAANDNEVLVPFGVRRLVKSGAIEFLQVVTLKGDLPKDLLASHTWEMFGAVEALADGTSLGNEDVTAIRYLLNRYHSGELAIDFAH